jgi:hypothetical protein
LKAMGEEWLSLCIFFAFFPSYFHGYEWDAIACLIDLLWDIMSIDKVGSWEVLCLCQVELMIRDTCGLCLRSQALFDRDCNRNESDGCREMRCMHLHDGLP